MRRRGNKSNKVPNVKLRPAQQGSMPRPTFEDCLAQETQLGSDDTMALDPCPRPFKGLVICATGIPEKPTLFKQAVELGATHTPAFTDRVTHLIADTHGGPKYNCAVERKVPIVKPTWIIENYQIWLRGDDVDAQKNLDDHRLPVFSGLIVCTSGITNITRRTEISKLVTAHGGTYIAKLERPVKVTHLLCSGDEETDKMRYAEKFNNKREANIQLVWEEWFWDSLHYGGRFEEATYQVRRPRPEPKPLPQATPPPPSSEVGSQHDQPPSSPAPHPPPRTNTNDSDEAEDEPAFVNVLPAVTLQLWGSLLDRRGYQITDGEVTLSPSKVKVDHVKKESKPPNLPHRPENPAGASVLSSVRRANSFAPVTRSDASSSRPIPFKRAATSAAVFAAHNAQAGPSTPLIVPPRLGSSSKDVAPPTDSKASVPAPQIFAGMTFRVLGEAKTITVRHAIEERGGRISTDDEEDTTFIIVRLVSGSKLYRQEDDEITRRKYRTECWLEHCLFDERVCAPEEHIFFLPLSISIPVNGTEKIVMCLSGFEDSIKHSLNRLLRALGITSTPVFNCMNTHLLCQSTTGPKYEKAREWGIPVVSLVWLQELTETGRVPDTKLYTANQVPERSVSVAGNIVEVEMADDSGVVNGKVVDKGKGKATAVELDGAMDLDTDRMQDITNSAAAVEHHSKSQPKKTGRQNTVIIPAPKPPEKKGSMFGLPNEILGGSSSPQLEDHAPDYALRTTTPPSLSMAMLQDDTETRQGSFTMTSSIQQEASTQDSDLLQRRIPSSTSPSPMRPPSLHKCSSSRQSLSPVKINPEATKALQESITSLLGKRPSPEAEESACVATTGQAKGSRPGKRVRPQRSKAQVQPLKVQTRSSTAAAATALRLDGVPLYVDPLNPFGLYPDEVDVPSNVGPPESQQESIRVVYEDPGQRDEKKRLMNILKGKSSQNGESLDRLPRRSQRIPGF